jgi:putative transcriptional regulator
MTGSLAAMAAREIPLMLSRKTTAAPIGRRTALGNRIAGAAREVAAHLRGEISLPTYQVAVPDAIDVAALRTRLGLSQAAFARAFGLDLAALQAWEQHRRRPDRTARILLAVIAREPEAVMRALAA